RQNAPSGSAPAKRKDDMSDTQLPSMTLLGKISRRALAALAVALVALPAAGQAPVKIGLIVPLSGPWARQGQVMRIGAEMAVEHINAQGGIQSLGGAPIQLVVVDAGDSVERAKNAAQRMVADHPGMVGATGSDRKSVV